MSLQLIDIRKSFYVGDTEHKVLDGFSFSFPDKGLYVVKGKSGCGKSTLLNIMSGFLKPDQGAVLLNGRSVTKDKGNEVREISNVFQHYMLLDGLSALDNTILPLLINGEPRASAVKKGKFLLARFGLESYASTKVSVLSGGERQRVAVCRALVTDPKVILADEPTGALDKANGIRVMECLKGISKDKLVIVVTHDLDLAEAYADQIVDLLNPIEGEAVSSSRDGQVRTKGRKKDWFPLLVKWLRGKCLWHFCTSFACGLLGFLLCLLCVGYVEGSNASIENESKNSPEYFSFSITEKTYSEIPNSPLKLVKRSRPSIESSKDATQGINGLHIVPSISYFLPAITNCSADSDVMVDVSFCPCSKDCLSLFAPSLEETNGIPCLVNSYLSKRDNLAKSSEISVKTQFVFDGFDYEVSFRFYVVEIIDVFGFMSSPTVYYSYDSAWLTLSDQVFGGYSVKEILSPTSTFETECDYSYLALADSLPQADRLMERSKSLIEEGSFISIESSYETVRESYVELVEAFNSISLIFIGVFIGLFTICIGYLSSDSVNGNMKDIAILMSLGASAFDISDAYLACFIASVAMAGVASVPTSLLASGLINAVIKNVFGFGSLIKVPLSSLCGFPYLLPLLVVTASLLIPFIGCFGTMRKCSKVSISNELKDE